MSLPDRAVPVGQLHRRPHRRHRGQGAKLEGLGTYLPKVGLDGTFDVSHRLDKAIENGLNAPGAFSGEN